MSDDLTFVVGEREAGRADRVVCARYPDISRRRITRLFQEHAVRVDGKRVRKGDHVTAGSTVQLLRPPAGDDDLRARPDSHIALPVVHEDKWLVVVNKPAGIPSHPLRASELGTAANAIAHRYPECVGIGDDPREAGLVHRLDTGTSGVLMAARDAKVWRAMRDAFAARLIAKSYLALVHGAATAGETSARLRQHGNRVIVSDEGLAATTSWTVAESLGDYTLVACVATSGRMHQVRAHLAHAGHPIAGDALYGGSRIVHAPLIAHFLHADSVSLTHPVTGQALRFHAPLPEDREATLHQLRAG